VDAAEKRDFDSERPSSHRNAPDELKEPDLELKVDDEFPQIHADGAFSADAMTNDIGRADNRTLSARIPSFRTFIPTLSLQYLSDALVCVAADHFEEIL